MKGCTGTANLAALLRARFCNDRIRGINKTDGLPFKVREILDGMHDKIKQSTEPALANV
jgi:hypothetical protein